MSSQQTIAHYRITGEGGMGEVYRATDTKLGREVAVKVLPAAFAGDPMRVERFQREAQVLASLNHPNIAAIYGAEERALLGVWSSAVRNADSPAGVWGNYDHGHSGRGFDERAGLFPVPAELRDPNRCRP
ncbi:MAG TPA: protein kinase [Candidatus Sulfopaludibacter sp.]|nr:protein kinase [Candidatus Sulfopaludibacter sp.]